MKVRIKNWDEAVRAALADSENWFIEDDSIFGIGCTYGNWGMVVEGYEEGGYFYTSNFAYPMCVVDKLEDYEPNPDDVLRYGKIIEVVFVQEASMVQDLIYGNMTTVSITRQKI